jgi:recombination protein RecA
VGKRRKRSSKLELTVARIRHQFGPRALTKGPPPRAFTAIPHISTGFPALDRALGIGGLPAGKISELAGFPTSGKTTLALKFLAQAQAGGGQAGYIDQARYFDPDYAHRCSLDLSRLVVGSPYTLEEALAMTEAIVRDGGLAAVVLDTVHAVWTDPRAAGQLAAWLGRLAAPLARSGTALLFLQDASAGGSPARSALSHYATVRLQVVRESWQRGHADIRGYRARVEVLKNRLGPAGQTVSIVITFNGTVHGDGL